MDTSGVINAPATSTVVNGLTPETNYEFQVQTHCQNNQIHSAFTIAYQFTTLCAVTQSQITFPATDITICVASPPIQLTATPVGGTFNGNCVSGDIFTPCTGVQQIIYTPADPCVLPDTVVITVVDILPNPTPVSGAPADVCANSGINSTFSIVPLATATGYVWAITPANAGTLTPNGTSASVQWNTAYSGTATITVKGSNSCGQGAETAFSVTVHPPPNVQLITGITYCQFSTPSFTGIPSGGTFTPPLNMFTGLGPQTYVYCYTDAFSCTNCDTSTVLVIGTPAAPATFHNTGPICQGQSITVSVDRIPGASAYHWTLPANINHTTTTDTFVTINLATSLFTCGDIPISVYASNSCGNGSSAQTVVTVVCTDTANFILPVNDTTVCISSPPFFLSATPTGGTFSGMCISGGIFSPQQCGLGQHTIVYTPLQSCILPTALTITVVDDLPAPTPSPLGGNQAVCNGGTYIYAVSPVTGATGYEWTINPPTAGTVLPFLPFPDGTVIQVAWTPGFTGFATVSCSAVNACGAGAAYTHNVFVDDTLTNATSGISPTVICNSNPTTLFTANTITGSTYPYYWSYTINGSTHNINGFNATANVNWANLIPANYCGELTITVRGGNTCGQGPAASFTVNRLCNITPIISPAGPYCVTSDTFHLNADIPGGDWSGCNVTVDGVYTPSATGQCQVIYTIDTLGCTGADTSVITVNPAPTVVITAPPLICANTSPTVQLSGNPQGGTFFPSNTVNTQVPPGEYIYTYTINGMNGCSGTDSATVEIIGPPVPDFTYEYINCYTVCIHDSTTPQPAIQIDWGDGVVSPAVNCHLYSDSGTYCITIRYINLCDTTDTTFCIDVGCVGIDETAFANAVNIYPNPTEGLINIRFNEAIPDDYFITLLDVTGKMLHNETARNIAGTYTLDIAGYATGPYILRIQRSDGAVINRLIVRN